MHDHGVAVFFQQLLLDQVNVGNGLHLFFQVAVILDINAAVGDHGGNGFCRVGIGLFYSDADIGPFHNAGSPFLLRFLLRSTRITFFRQYRTLLRPLRRKA